MTKKVKYNVLLIINSILVVALIFSVFMLVNKNKSLLSAREEVSQKQESIEQQKLENSDLQSQLEAAGNEKEKLQDENKKLESERQKLESENKKLKDQIKELKNKKPSGSAGNTGPVLSTSVPQNHGPSGKICYLTFDDGPSENTLKILDILNKYKIKATFFVINTSQTKIQYVKRISEAGHAVGLHSNSHNYAKIYKNTKAYYSDLDAISAAVEKYTGTTPKIMRFPGGSSNTVSKAYCKNIMSVLTRGVTQKGYTYFDWNVDSGDASGNGVKPSVIVNNVLNSAKGKNSICVLMHDSAAKTTTAEALPKIIEGLKDLGFSFESLSEKSYGFHHNINN